MSASHGTGTAAADNIVHDVVRKYYSSLYPSFAIFPSAENLLDDFVKLPDLFLHECHETIPRNIKLLLPNGHENTCKFRRSDNSLRDMSEFHKCVRGILGSIVIYSYIGEGKFNVSVLGPELNEVIYFLNRNVERGGGYDQDLVNGKGWKFFVDVDNNVAQFSKIRIHPSFYRMFGKRIPHLVNFYLKNGNKYQGSYFEGALAVVATVDPFADFHLTENDKLLVTYFGDGNFFIMVFNSENVEKAEVPQTVDSDSSTGSERGDDDVVELDVAHGIDDLAAGMGDAQINDDEISFTSAICRSHLDGKSHGMYIPSNVRPANRMWEAGERVTFRTEDGEWEVGIVVSGSTPRFSSGWNTFCRDNNLWLNDTLVFTLIEETDGHVFFITFPDHD